MAGDAVMKREAQAIVRAFGFMSFLMHAVGADKWYPKARDDDRAFAQARTPSDVQPQGST
jgi:hypothetical protein